MHQFDPDCAIFVCNKWDEVQDHEEDEVWQEISKQLRKYWPTSGNVDITEKMFKLSIKEVCTIKIKCNIEQFNTMLIINFIWDNLI